MVRVTRAIRVTAVRAANRNQEKLQKTNVKTFIDKTNARACQFFHFIIAKNLWGESEKIKVVTLTVTAHIFARSSSELKKSQKMKKENIALASD